MDDSEEISTHFVVMFFSRTLKRFSSQAAGVKLLRLYETITLKRNGGDLRARRKCRRN
jgi:hypothetical protein